MPSSRRDLLDGLIAARARHGDRSPAARFAQVAGGLVMLLLALPLAIVVPELGVPLLLLALRLLADEFDWAARAYATVAWRWERFRGWFAARSWPQKALVVAALSVVALIILAALTSTG